MFLIYCQGRSFLFNRRLIVWFKKTVFGVITLFAFLVCFLLASYLTDNTIKLAPVLQTLVEWVDSLFKDEVKPVQPNTKLKANESAALPFSYEHIIQPENFTCKETVKGKLKYKKVGTVYTWTDDNDIYHFSDKPPVLGEFKSINYAGKKVLDYFDLTLKTNSLPYDFNQQLSLKLTKLFELYGQLLDRSALRKIDIKLTVFASKSGYEYYKNSYKDRVSANALGFYIGDKNEAALFYTTPSQTMRTALHEATHAINQGIIGFTPRWLNEGLAEYVEQLQPSGNFAIINPNTSWLAHGYVRKPLVSLSTLFNNTQDSWQGKQEYNLYATSWSFVHFMMETPQRRIQLAKLINYELQNKCDRLTITAIMKVLGIPLPKLEHQFNLWLTHKVKSQRI